MQNIKYLFWYLPHDLRRIIYRLTHSRQFYELQLLRNSSDVSSIHSFEKNNCIFVHIPKTGGVSVAMSLFGHLLGHRTLRQYQLIYSYEEYCRYFKFAFVRNPWDRLLSAYLFLKQGGLYPHDKAWAEQYLDPYPTFESFVKEWVTPESILTQKHFRPQFLFIRGANNEPDLDFVGFYETLTEDFRRVCNKLDIDAKLPHLNKNKSSLKRNYLDYFTSDTRAIVECVYSEDIRLFGYSFGDRRTNTII